MVAQSACAAREHESRVITGVGDRDADRSALEHHCRITDRLVALEALQPVNERRAKSRVETLEHWGVQVPPSTRRIAPVVKDDAALAK